MLKPITLKPAKNVKGRFAIIAARYNKRYTDALVRFARETLVEAQAGEIEIVRVPGAFEIPAVAARFAKNTEHPVAAIICLAVVLRGETTHAQHITEAVSHALARLQIDSGVPIIHGVGLYETDEQARVRCLSSKHNRGKEAALTALEMARVMAGLG